MPPFDNIDDLFENIEMTSDRIADVLSQFELIDEDAIELNEIYNSRNILITELVEYMNSEDIKLKEKVRIREFIDLIAAKDYKNINSLDLKLKDIGQKIKFLNNKKNLNVYSQWSK